MSVDFNPLDIPVVQRLIGCCWGRSLWDPNEDQPCTEQAVQIIVLHHNGEEIEARLCAHHSAVVLALTNPSCPECDGTGMLNVPVEGPDSFGNYDTVEVSCQRCFTGPWQRCALCGEYFGMDLHNGPCSDCDPNR